MDKATCGRFELALKFKLFAIGMSVYSAPLCLASLLFQFSCGSASIREGFASLFHTYPLYSIFFMDCSSSWRGSYAVEYFLSIFLLVFR